MKTLRCGVEDHRALKRGRVPFRGLRSPPPSGLIQPDGGAVGIHRSSRSRVGWSSVDRRKRLHLAAESQLDPRTIDRAEALGVTSVRSEADRDRLRAACRKLHVPIAEHVPGGVYDE